MENIRSLYRTMTHLKARRFKLFAVGRTYDDDLYAWASGDRIPLDRLTIYALGRC